MLVLKAATEVQSLAALLEKCGWTNRAKFQVAVVKPLLAAGLLEMTIPDKPRSSRQRYRTTRAGMELLKENGSETDREN